jgi:hypothetical protein
MGVEESHKGSETRVSHRGRQRRQVDCTGVCAVPNTFFGLVELMMSSHRLDVLNDVLPATEMLRMPFAELLKLMHQARTCVSSWAHPRG